MLYTVLLTDTQNMLKYHPVTVKPSFAVKTIDCLHQTGPIGKNRNVRYVSHMLHVYHVYSSVGCCVKNGTYSSSNHEWKL